MRFKVFFRFYSELKQYDKIRKKRTLENFDPPKWQQGDWEYQWQGNGMLKAVRNPQGKWIRFEYDALGRRTAKIVTTKIYRYLWDGNVLLHEWFYENERRPKVVSDELGMFMLEQPEPIENLTTWVYEEGSLVPTAKLCEDKPYSIVSDYLGRPAQAYDDKGELVWQVEFDIYGRIRLNLFNNKQLFRSGNWSSMKFVNRYFLIILLMLPMSLMYAKPFIDSYNSNEKEIKINLFHKSKTCGFIHISKESKIVTIQFYCGWSNFGKGYSKLSNIYFDYNNNYLIIISKATNKKIFEVKCNKQIFDEIIVLVDNIQ